MTLAEIVGFGLLIGSSVFAFIRLKEMVFEDKWRYKPRYRRHWFKKNDTKFSKRILGNMKQILKKRKLR